MQAQIGGNEPHSKVLTEGIMCPNCHVQMHWFHTTSFKLAEEKFLAHAYQCENCYGIEQRSERDTLTGRRI